jgi:hypothetical protein
MWMTGRLIEKIKMGSTYAHKLGLVIYSLAGFAAIIVMVFVITLLQLRKWSFFSK